MDAAIFYAIQSFAGVSPGLDLIGIFCASVLIWVIAAAVIVFFVEDRRRSWVIAGAAVSGVIAWLASEGIGLLYFRPRPFAALADVRLLINKSPLDKSFPSDHASIAFAIAFAVFFVDRRWGVVLLTLAALVSIGRVFVGVHYPSDILAGALLGLICAFLVHRLIHYFLHTKHRQPKHI